MTMDESVCHFRNCHRKQNGNATSTSANGGKIAAKNSPTTSEMNAHPQPVASVGRGRITRGRLCDAEIDIAELFRLMANDQHHRMRWDEMFSEKPKLPHSGACDCSHARCVLAALRFCRSTAPRCADTRELNEQDLTWQSRSVLTRWYAAESNPKTKPRQLTQTNQPAFAIAIHPCSSVCIGGS